MLKLPCQMAWAAFRHEHHALPRDHNGGTHRRPYTPERCYPSQGRRRIQELESRAPGTCSQPHTDPSSSVSCKHFLSTPTDGS